MTYKLFIDDERFPLKDDWVIARTSKEAIDIVCERGMPVEIAFDHDLGGKDTSLVFLNWLQEMLLDKVLEFPPGFSYSVHSQNPVGAVRIDGWMRGMINHL